MPATASHSSGYQTFYKTNPDGGDRLERAVHTVADAVAARFDGYFPDPDPQPAKTTNKTAGASSSSAGT